MREHQKWWQEIWNGRQIESVFSNDQRRYFDYIKLCRVSNNSSSIMLCIQHLYLHEFEPLVNSTESVPNTL